MIKEFIFITSFIRAICCASRCPSNALLSTAFGRCYHFINQKESSFKGQLGCEMRDAKVLSMESEKEANLISEYAKHIFGMEENISDFWIGSRFMDDRFRTIDDLSLLTFMNWEKGEPPNQTEGHCIAALIRTGKWFSRPCEEKRPTVCASSVVKCMNTFDEDWRVYSDRYPYIKRNLEPSMIADIKISDVIRCKPDEVHADSLDVCLKFITIPKQFFEAIADCRARNSDVVTMETMVKRRMIKKYADSIFHANITHYWLGATRTLGKWLWIDGTELDEKTWIKGSQRRDLIEQCLMANKNGEWITAKCYTLTLPYICMRNVTDSLCGK